MNEKCHDIEYVMRSRSKGFPMEAEPEEHVPKQGEEGDSKVKKTICGT